MLPDHLRSAHLELMQDVELYVYGVRGERYGVMVDAGISAMRERLIALAGDVGNVGLLLVTHAHADHIGCLRALREATGAMVVAAGGVPWIEDLERHYVEFCRTDSLPDSSAQREEILGLMEGGAQVDVVVTAGTRFALGGGVELETIALPGHKLEEVAFLDRSSGSLVMGDVLPALAAPFFHGFQSARALRESLQELRRLVDGGSVQRVLSSHHHPMGPEAALERIAASRGFLDTVEEATLAAATGVEFDTLWKRVCAAMGKELEFRGYAMLEVQVAELVEDGRLVRDGERILRP